MTKTNEMATDILKQIKVTNGEGGEKAELTFFINTNGNVFIQECDGTNMTDFWMEIEYNDWMEVVKFIDAQKK